MALTDTSKPSSNPYLTIGKHTIIRARLSQISNYYIARGANLRNQTASKHSNKPSSQRYHHQKLRLHNTLPTSPLPYAETTRCGDTPSKTPAKIRYYPAHYSTRSPYLIYTIIRTTRPLSQTTTHTTTMTPST